YVLERLYRMGLETQTPEGAFYVFPSIVKYGLNSTEFCTRLLREAHVAVTPGLCFGADNHIRISYCCGDEDLTKGMDRLERFVETLER
nr:aminotransferase class I/II-fold pyridoxal phosphate-dependent enzyme [Fretibacterium sp.]